MIPDTSRSHDEISRLVDNLLLGDGQPLMQQARAMQAEGGRFLDIAVQLIDPVLVEVGERWAGRDVSVGHEHLATALCQQVVSYLRMELPRPDPETAPVAVVSCGPYERHSLGAEIVAGVLQDAGWRVAYLGADTPPEGVVAIMEEWMASLVALSVGTVTAVPETAELVEWIKDRHPGCRVVVGGQAAEM
ncbi:MAG: cobalamin-dependent protein, partial [Chloroflexota bacterium]|nr:cobalamin-dependent protein [Chloroflexota bacterium]